MSKRLMKRAEKAAGFRAMYIMAFMFAMSFAVPLYINSSFLGEFASDQTIGLIYTIGSIVTLILLGMMPTILSRFGNYATTVVISFIQVLLFSGLALFQNPLLIVPIFILNSSLISIIFFNFDVYLESFIKDEGTTGGVRGTFLTITNVGVLVSPLLAGFILGEDSYYKVYLAAAAFMALMGIIAALYFKNFKDPKYKHVPVWDTMNSVWHNADMHKVFMVNLLLKMFFAWMVIYSPIYLHETVGFSWSELGVIFTIMLLPYVLFELPAGKLADKKWGEKEIMSAGFIIAGISTVAMSFIVGPSFIIWAVVLFITRTGASLIEITSESYFFKHVKGGDTDVISFFRDTRPIAYIIGPLLGSGLLYLMDIRYLFLVLGLLMIFGLKYSLTLRDTK